ncbi:MAG TPA: hypothetical protein VHP63_00300 [candidate division Zixibacteria bacterium]|nr:hypothetical protein [candidate division Zixibacteria bacterium]
MCARLIFGVLVLTATLFSAEPVEKEFFTFYFDNPNYVERANSALLKVRTQMIGLVQDSLTNNPSVYLLENMDEFNKVIRGRIPDWGAAAAFPERNLMALKSPDKFRVGKSIEELLAHEYSHLLLHHRTGFANPPRWFDEGLAMLVSLEWDWEDNLAMSRAGTFGQFIKLKEIEYMNRFGAAKAEIAYSQSYLAVEYMYREYGNNSVNRFLNSLKAGVSLDSAFSAGIGATYSEFEEEFNTYLRARYNIASLFMDTMLFWVFLAVMVIVAGFIRYKKRRQYYKKWAEEEKLHSKDFDYGDSKNPEQIDDEDEPWRS